MQRLEVSGAVRHIYGSLGFKQLTNQSTNQPTNQPNTCAVCCLIPVHETHR